MLEGVIIFMQANVGSKSEMLASYLYMGEGKLQRVRLLGANPFMSNALNDYDGKKVKITGEYNDDGVFMIETIENA